SHESRLRISLAGVCEVVQALVVDEAEDMPNPRCEVVQALLVARRRDVPNPVLMVLLAGVCEMVQALVVDEAEGRSEPHVRSGSGPGCCETEGRAEPGDAASCQG
ncbi:hypothetical protein MTP99_003894, partial [Tenebrio molitor]